MDGLDNNANSDVLYLDFAKAFDKVDHHILISKLQNIGIHGKLLAWIKSFLSNRTQRVIVDGVHSEPTKVISGVPQGTVLGPLLFIIFINDIYDAVTSSHIWSFADDTRLTKIIHTKDDQELLQKDLHAVVKWANDNNMALHEQKFELLQHGTRMDLKGEISHQYKVSEDINIIAKSSVEDLGVTVHESLKWSEHIQKVSKCAMKMGGWVLRTFHTRNKFVMLTLFKSLVRSRVA